MEKTLIISGEGGQGIKLCGKIFAKIMHDLGNHVSFVVKYDAAVRGGQIHTEISISENRVDNPIVENADILIKLTQKDITKTSKEWVCQEGYECKAKNTKFIDFIRITKEKCGKGRFINMVLLGWLLKHFEGEIGKKINELEVENYLPKLFIVENLNAIEVGANL